MSHHTDAPAGEGAQARAARIATARLYLCTDARTGPGDLENFLHAAYAGGVDIIQLRDKSIGTADELAALEILARAARAHGKLFAVNDRADVASLTGADAVPAGRWRAAGSACSCTPCWRWTGSGSR